MSVGNKTALNMVKERKQTKHVDHWIKVNKNEWSCLLLLQMYRHVGIKL